MPNHNHSLFLFVLRGPIDGDFSHLNLEAEEKSNLFVALRKAFLQEKSTEPPTNQKDFLDHRVIIILILSLLCGFFKKAIFQVQSLFFPILLQTAAGRNLLDEEEDNTENPPVQESLELRCSVIPSLLSSPPLPQLNNSHQLILFIKGIGTGWRGSLLPSR